jgi:serine/threonine protein kinase
MAPEVIQSEGGYSAKIDIWSLGCVVLEMFAGKRPWSTVEAIGAMFKVLHLTLILMYSWEMNGNRLLYLKTFKLTCPQTRRNFWRNALQCIISDLLSNRTVKQRRGQPLPTFSTTHSARSTLISTLPKLNLESNIPIWKPLISQSCASQVWSEIRYLFMGSGTFWSVYFGVFWCHAGTNYVTLLDTHVYLNMDMCANVSSSGKL